MKIENADNGKGSYLMDYSLDFNISQTIGPNDPIKPDIAHHDHDKKIKDEVVKRFNMHERLAEIIARNLVAWDTSKDKSTGLLPEVYLTNKRYYELMTGEEYTFRRACKRFNIGG